ncbi:MAG: MAPEG family protein [Sulfitobacter sp.]
MMLSITPIYAGVMALILITLSALVVRQRVIAHKAGDLADEVALNKSMRVQANFIEYVPLALILMLCAELQGAPAAAVHAMGVTLVVARLAHAVGMSRTPQVSLLRGAGFLLTSALLVFSALAVIGHALS